MTNALITSSLFGGLFSDPDCAAPFGAQAFLAHILEVEAAWTRGLGVAGVIDDATAARILHAIAQIQPNPAALAAGAQRDGMVVPALIALIRADLPAEVRDVLHLGLTSQDVMDTGLVLCLRAALGVIEHRLQQIEAALEDLSLRWGAAPLMGRTRMQAALPIGAAARIGAWQRPVMGHLAALKAVRTQMLRAQFGGPVGLRDTPTPAQAGLAASEAAHSLGLGLGPVWHTDRTGFVATGNWLAMVAGSLGKIGQDIALMAQGDEIALRGAGTSSAMAHKSNPVGAEITVALARHVAHMQGLLAQAMIHEQERSGSAWALEWMCLPTMVEGTGAATRHVLALIRGVDRLGPAPPT